MVPPRPQGLAEARLVGGVVRGPAGVYWLTLEGAVDHVDALGDFTL